MKPEVFIVASAVSLLSPEFLRAESNSSWVDSREATKLDVRVHR
jgi:hypothetical protein